MLTRRRGRRWQKRFSRFRVWPSAISIDNQRCKFVVSVPVWAGGVRRFTDADEAKGSPLAEAIFAIPGLAVSDLDRQPTLQVCRERPGVGWWSTPIHGC